MIPGIPIPGSGALAALFRVPIPYVLEVLVDGNVTSSTCVPNYPGGLSIQQPHATAIRFTAGEAPVRELTKNRSWMLTVQGHSGLAARSGYDSNGRVVFAPGPEVVAHFREFLDKYQSAAAAQTDRVELVFRALDEGLHYKVEMLNWSQTWEASRNPFSNEWAVQFRSYGKATPQKPPNILSPVSDWFEVASAQIQQINGYVALGQNALVNLRGDMEVLRGPLQRLQQTAQALQGVTQGARGVARFPAAMVSDLANAAVSFQNVWHDLVGDRAGDALGVNGWTALRGEWQRLQTRLGYMAEDVAREATEVMGLSGATARDYAAAETRVDVVGPQLGGRPALVGEVEGRRTRNFATTALRAGEDLRGVAQRFYGDTSRAEEIARYNGWLTFERLSTGRPAQVGERVLVPLDVSLEAADPAEFVDIWRGPDDDFQFTEDGNFRLVRGTEALRQGLRGRLQTVQGGASGFPQYGLPRTTGTALTSAVAALAASHLREQLLRDPRTEDVLQLEVTHSGDELVCSATVSFIENGVTPLDVLVPLPRNV